MSAEWLDVHARLRRGRAKDDSAADEIRLPSLFVLLLLSLVATHVAVGGASRSAIEGLIDLRGVLGLDPSAKVGFDAIRITVKVEADASEAEVDELIELAARYSPVLDTVTDGSEIIVRRGF